ncbi:hypothetical protein FQR65_LT14370 [Abscondita terminalis]|nr:hypothetical protein FQR65_LT14370 [Abscondita terminalis]
MIKTRLSKRDRASNISIRYTAIDLFGPLPEAESKETWIFIIEDTATRWVELFAIVNADAKTCAQVLIKEVFYRYGTPRRLISDNGTQFVSNIMQHVVHCLGINQSLTSSYHPQANPVERKNRDLKPQLAILVGKNHHNWPNQLAPIRFAMNTARNQATGYSAAYLNMARELRTTDDCTRDQRAIIMSDNFIPEITPYLPQITDTLRNAKLTQEQAQKRSKKYSDEKKTEGNQYQPEDWVWVNSNPISKAAKGITAKLAPRRDGPYRILHNISPTTYEIENPNKLGEAIGSYHTSALTPFHREPNALPKPVQPLRKRGRPKKILSAKEPGRLPGQKGEAVTNL